MTSYLSSFITGLKGLLTTKGDILSYSTTEARLGVGANDTVLTADSSKATGLKWATGGAGANTALSNLSSVSVNDTINMNTNDLTNIQFLQLKTTTELTISSGNITPTQSYHRIDTQSGASTDSLDGFLSMVTGQLLILRSENSSRDPTLRDSITGGNKMNGAGNFTLDNVADRWTGLGETITPNFKIYELSRSDNN
jgi:hypothetical protein